MEGGSRGGGRPSLVGRERTEWSDVPGPLLPMIQKVGRDANIKWDNLEETKAQLYKGKRRCWGGISVDKDNIMVLFLYIEEQKNALKSGVAQN